MEAVVRGEGLPCLQGCVGSVIKALGPPLKKNAKFSFSETNSMVSSVQNNVFSSWCTGIEPGRDKLSLFELFSLYDGEKECRGYTLFPHLITMGKKSVEYTFKFPPY